MHWRRKWQPTPVFLPGESQGQGSLVGCRLWGRTELDMTEATAAAAAYIVLQLCKNIEYLIVYELMLLLSVIDTYKTVYLGEQSVPGSYLNINKNNVLKC